MNQSLRQSTGVPIPEPDVSGQPPRSQAEPISHGPAVVDLNSVTLFRGEHEWLSNFHREPCGLTVEHRFQAWKAISSDDARRIMEAPTPGEAKRLGREIKIRPDWEQIKTTVMLQCVRRKFTDPGLRQSLIDTGYAVLVEGNTWGDRVWGVDLRTGQGENRLGRILMLVRLEIVLRVIE